MITTASDLIGPSRYQDIDSGFGSGLQWQGYGAHKLFVDNCFLIVESNTGGEEEIHEEIRQGRRKDKAESAVFGRPGRRRIHPKRFATPRAAHAKDEVLG